MRRLYRILGLPPLPEPPDPDTLPQDQWNEATTARARAGLKPWPQRPDDDYHNEVIAVCSVCKIKVYGCQAASWGWVDGKYDERCGAHFRSRESE